MANSFYVVGGEYEDTTFQNLAAGQENVKLGPFDEREALNVWRGLTGKSVDNALIRFFVVHETELASSKWLVVGGEYSDTGFQKLAKGAQLQVIGPFDRNVAMNKWRELTGRTIDSAVTRFEIIAENELDAFKASHTNGLNN